MVCVFYLVHVKGLSKTSTICVVCDKCLLCGKYLLGDKCQIDGLYHLHDNYVLYGVFCMVNAPV